MSSLYIDFDGVLFDTLDMSWRATAEVLFKYGVVPEYRTDALSGLPLHFYVENFWGRSWQAGLQGVGEYYHGGGFTPSRSGQDLQQIKDMLVKEALAKLDAPVNTGALALLVFASAPIVYCTAGGPRMATFKAALADDALKRVGAPRDTVLICNVDKTNPAFWREQDAAIVIDDDIRVIKAAESAGHRTIHWREFLPKGI